MTLDSFGGGQSRLDAVEALGLTGHEVFEISGLSALSSWETTQRLTLPADQTVFSVRSRIETSPEADYCRHGGILTYVPRPLAGEST